MGGQEVVLDLEVVEEVLVVVVDLEEVLVEDEVAETVIEVLEALVAMEVKEIEDMVGIKALVIEVVEEV